MRRWLWVVCGAAGAVLYGCSASLDFDELSSEHWRVEGAPAGVFRADNGKCLDAEGCGGPSGRVQMCECGERLPQQRWTVARDDTLRAQNKCLDLAEPRDSDGVQLTLAECNASASQGWLVLHDKVLHTGTSKCLDVSANVTGEGSPLQLWTCRDGNLNQAWKVPGPTRQPGPFGDSVLVFEPTQPASEIQHQLNAVFALERESQFGEHRFALLFAPGEYDVQVQLGFYTQVLGLGRKPDDVVIHGNVRVDADWNDQPANGDPLFRNATFNFLRGVENLSVVPAGREELWLAARGTSYRRMHLDGDLIIAQQPGWNSGGFIADSLIDGDVRGPGQQQWLARSSQWQQWRDEQWNYVFVGDVNAPAPSPIESVVPTVPRIREKPFLYRTSDADADYQVFVPALRTDAPAGPSWTSARGEEVGTSVPLADFMIATPADDADALNAALDAGRHLLLTPGIYELQETLRVSRSDTIVLGIGLATLKPNGGVVALQVADEADGVKIAGLLVDAGSTLSPKLMAVGEPGSTRDHAANPSSLHDVYFRVGGPSDAAAAVSLEIASSNVIADNLWFWRASQIAKYPETAVIGWDRVRAANALTVGGRDVTVYGLFAEHYQEHQVRWLGEGGETYLFMSELPFDMPDQSEWRDGDQRGFPAYQVAPEVREHRAVGLSAYCASFGDGVSLDRAFVAPEADAISFTNMVTVSLDGKCAIDHVFNERIDPDEVSSMLRHLSFP
ncbi:MAG: RICIN domain-containing protein [Polyangiales bacterium]